MARQANGTSKLWKWGLRVFFGLLIVVSIGGVVSFVTMTFGRVQGEEFSPDDFTRRRFHYFELPIVGFKVSPIYRQATTGQLERHLVKKKILARRKVKAENKQWDLIHIQRGMRPPVEADPTILCGYLDLRGDDGKLKWLTWTEAQPALAKILWPAVADAARRELYILTPDLLELGKSVADEEEFRRQMRALLGGKYRDFGIAQHKLGNHDAAVDLLSAALKWSPGDAQALSARADAYDALGKKDLAAKDSAAANKSEAAQKSSSSRE